VLNVPQKRNPAKPYSREHRGSLGSRQALTELPAVGCQLPIPTMPSGREWTEVERERWTELWSSPQATQWDETARGTVATLVIYETAILSSNASAWMAQEARYAAESLGLTPRSMTSLGWRIVE
jgi:hypothetical protein